VRILELGTSHVPAETKTDALGIFSFASLSAKRIRVEAEHDPGGAVRSAPLSVSDEPAEITLVLAPASVRGVVVDASDGHPVAGAALSVDGVPWSVPGITSGADGSFRFPVVSLEATAVEASAAGYRAARIALGPRDDQPETVLRIALSTGPAVEGDVFGPDGRPLHARVIACEGQSQVTRVESGDDGTFKLPPSTIGCDVIALHDEMAPSDAARVVEGRRLSLRLGDGGAIAGSVVDDRGNPVDSFSIGVESGTTPHGYGTGRGATPFHGGTFRFDRLIPGTYVLVATAQGKPPARSDSIDVRAGSVFDGVRIVLGPGGMVVGRVVDERNTPIEGVELRYDLVTSIANSDSSTKTDSAGRYRLEGAPPGPFTVRAQKTGYRPKLVSGLLLNAGRTLNKDITLSSAQGDSPPTEFVGIGAHVGVGAGALVFKGVFPGDPAERAGIREGDRIVSVDGEDASRFSPADAIQRIRGESGSSVGISVERDGKVLDFVVARGNIVH
jgi:hypothetical protein